jgi:flavin reductase (DIM6/NTAB) family NADH-FMN oxidoreductase RutF
MVTGQPAAAVAAGGYRTLMSSFPTGVAVVCALAGDDRPHGMTCTSLCSVTVEPPTLLVSLHVASGTCQAVRERGCFALNLLHQGGREAAEVFSSPTPDRFARVAWRPSPVVGAPWLVDAAFAVAECRTTQLLAAGDHTLVLGEVVNVHHLPGTPLLYGLRQFAVWPG